MLRGRPRRLAALTVVALGLASGASAVAAAVSGPPPLRPVSLPRDHGAHAGFGVEWWYTAGSVRGSDGHRYFWFATAWAAPQGVVSRVNLLDLDTGKTVFADQNLVASPLHSGQRVIPVGRFTIGLYGLGRRGRWTAADTASSGDRLSLGLIPQAPYVRHGHRGIIAQGPGARSAYYSEPRLAAHGTLTLAGHRVTLSGLGWLDHQWGNFAGAGSLRWNWFACQLHDGRDLMLYEFLDAHERPTGVAAGTLVTRTGAVTDLHRFTATPLSPSVHPPGARSRYPLGWRLDVPGAGLAMRLRSLTRAGFITNIAVPSFWEAPARVTRGPAGGCIVESSREV